MKKVIVVTEKKDFTLQLPDVEVLTAREYLTGPAGKSLRNIRLYNLCRQYRYQSSGYYVSLLAEARNHRPIPSIITLQDALYDSVIGYFKKRVEKRYSEGTLYEL